MLQPRDSAGAKVVPLKASKNKEVTKPYEPTAREAEALAIYEKRKAKKIPAPGMKVTMSEQDDKPAANLAVDHPDLDTGTKLLAEALGTDDVEFLAGALNSLGMVAQDGNRLDEGRFNYALSMVRGLQPKDQIESTLAVQMAAIHFATVRMASRLGSTTSRETIEAYEKSLNRLARTYVAQMEGLKRYRSKGEQRVYVERVNVNEGGQAIVGPVSRGGRNGGIDENGD
jgi:hypothetical protein